MSVYFMTCRYANAVKIGFSHDAHGRVREIQLGCPMPIKLEAVLPGTMEDERTFHARFSEHRLSGEWFTITPIMEAIIEANPAPPPPAGRTPGYREPRNTRTAVARVRSFLRLPKNRMAQLLDIEPDMLRRYENGFGRWAELPSEVEAKLRALAAERGDIHLVKEIEAAL